MNWLLDGLVAWGIAAPIGAAMFYRRKSVAQKAGPPVYEKRAGQQRQRGDGLVVGGLCRAEQHKHDAEHNPNYRGGFCLPD